VASLLLLPTTCLLALNLLPPQLNRALDQSRRKHALWQLRLAAISQKSHATGTAAECSPPPPPSDHPDNADRGSELNLELLYVFHPYFYRRFVY
jgi:hypothetical protein